MVTIYPPKQRTLSNDKRNPKNPRELMWLDAKTLIVIDTDEVWSINGITTRDRGFKWVTKLEEGKNYAIEKTIDQNGNFVAYYCDICSPIKLFDNDYEYYDWYLDVFKTPSSDLMILDEDEFEEAVKSKLLSVDEIVSAKKALDELKSLIKNNLLDMSNSENI